jgi:hypothetical protein
MKRLMIIMLVSLLGAGSISAQQIVKGSKMVNVQATNLGFNSISYSFDGADEDASMSRFGLGAAAGYAFMDDIMLIGQLSFQSLKIDEMKFSAVTIGASGRKYFANGLFAGAGLNILNGKIDDGGDDSSTTMVDGVVHAGLAIELLPKLTLEPMVAFSTKLAGGSVDGYDDVKLTYTHLSINIGFSYYF